jgi:ribosomal protein L22
MPTREAASNTGFTSKDVERLARALAKEADISTEQAHKVLQILHVDKVAENLDALQRILQDEKASNALGLSRKRAQTAARGLTPSRITLDTLRVGIKPTGRAACTIA